MIKKFNNYLNETTNTFNRDEIVNFILENQDRVKDENDVFPFYTEELDKMNNHELTLYHRELQNLLKEQNVTDINESKRDTVDILRLNKYVDFDDLKGFIQKIDSNFVYIYDITKSVKEDNIVKISLKDFMKKYSKYNKANS
jgi:hypothetical protein